MKNIIFLFSLPRSGSTLLQRILMSHNEIASVAEPWLLLPFCYAFKKEGVLTEYSHATSYTALEDFINNLPNGKEDYYSALREFTFELYRKHCSNNEKYFLDKTPRYYNIITEIAKIFPDAKFIFLFRNPAHIKASMINAWGNGRLKYMYAFHRDLHVGFRAISKGYEILKWKSYALRYEELVINPEKYIKEICDYLNIRYDKNMLVSFVTQNTKGRMGDLTGTKQYKDINKSTLDKWKKTFDNSFRQKMLLKYIDSIEEKFFQSQGYNKKQIIEEISNMRVKKGIFIRDRIDYVYSNVVRIVKPNIWFAKNTKKWAKEEYLC